jgi:hypothetical protein
MKKVKLKRELQGKSGASYPKDTWLDVVNVDGFLFVKPLEGNNLKMIADSNIKERK